MVWTIPIITPLPVGIWNSSNHFRVIYSWYVALSNHVQPAVVSVRFIYLTRFSIHSHKFKLFYLSIYIFVSIHETPQLEHPPDCRFLHYFRLPKRATTATPGWSKRSTFQAALKQNDDITWRDSPTRTYGPHRKSAGNWRPFNVISNGNMSWVDRSSWLWSLTAANTPQHLQQTRNTHTLTISFSYRHYSGGLFQVPLGVLLSLWLPAIWSNAERSQNDPTLFHAAAR